MLVSQLPAVLVEGHHEALVLNAGHRGEVPVFAGEHLVPAVVRLPADVCVLRSVEPEQRHHHLAVLRALPQRAHLGNVGQVLLPVPGGEEDAVLHRHLLVPLLVSHGLVADPLHWQLLVLKDGNISSIFSCAIQADRVKLAEQSSQYLTYIELDFSNKTFAFPGPAPALLRRLFVPLAPGDQHRLGS